jgi:hypothetical protein
MLIMKIELTHRYREWYQPPVLLTSGDAEVQGHSAVDPQGYSVADLQ